MGLTDKAKELADVALEKAGEYSEKAAGKAAELSEVAREKAPGYLDRVADFAGRAVEAAAVGVDKATGGRFHEHLEGATTKVGETLDRTRPGSAGGSTQATTDTKNFFPEEPDVTPRAAAGVVQDGAPITPASTNPEAAGEQAP